MAYKIGERDPIATCLADNAHNVPCLLTGSSAHDGPDCFRPSKALTRHALITFPPLSSHFACTCDYKNTVALLSLALPACA